MRVSGEDAVSVSVKQEVPLVGLSVGLLRSLQWMRRVEALVGQKRLLLGVSWSAGSLALLLLFCAIAMDSWLFTVEREPDETSNATFLITLHSGLWRVCKKNQFMKDVGKNTQWNLSWLVHDYHFENCSSIPHFQQRGKEAGELKPTESILYSMRPAAFFPPAGLLLLCLGGGCGLAACWGRQRSRRLLFLSGGACIVSGILTLIGIVLYVGSVSLAFDSISGPLRVETRYVYSFGAAFRLCIGAFVLSEFSGVFVIHLFLAELRHRQNQRNKARVHGYNMMNSVSTDLLSPSRIPTATTSVAQISLTENCLDKAKPGDTPFASANRRPPVLKSNHLAISNHITNSTRVKVIPHTKPSNTKIQVSGISVHSLESPATTEIVNNSSLEDTVRWASVKRRRMVDLTAESMTSVLPVGRLRRGNARSAVNIRTEEEIPDFISCHKSTRSSKQLLYYSCRECEQMVKQQQQHQQQRHQQHQNNTTNSISRRSPNFQQMPTSESTSSTSSDSITPSVSISYSSYSGSEEKLSDKLYYDPSPRRLPRSQCLRQPDTAANKRRSAGSSSNKNTPTSKLQRVEGSTASDSERGGVEPLPTAVCRCLDSCSGAETLASLSEALAHSPSSTLNTPLQRPKKRAKPYQQVTSI